MADNVTVTITGLDGVNNALAELPPKVRRRVLRKALKAGGDILAREVRERAPVKTDNRPGGTSLPAGTLKADITMTINTSNREVAGTAKVGPSTRTDHVANWVEFGHAQVTRSKKKVGHVPAHPFMRPSFDAAADRAVEAFGETLLAGLDELGETSS